MKRLQEEIREYSVQTGFNETGMGLFSYIFEDKSNVPWSYVSSCIYFFSSLLGAKIQELY